MGKNTVAVLGLNKLRSELMEVIKQLDDIEVVTKELDIQMNKVVHIVTGYLKSTIYHKGNVAGADAPYAGYEEGRGGSHAYATRAIEALDIEKFADHVWRPLD